MLVGRDSERRQVAALVRSARAGRGGALVLRGDPGIGKTALLDAAREEAAGLLVLSATGVESEAALPFAALGDVLRPILDLRAELAPAQRAALEAALALGPPAVADRFAAYAGAFALLEAAARRRPLLVAIDDAHWLDAPSAEALAFAARRLEDVPLALLVAQRSGEGTELVPAGAEVIVLSPLPQDAAASLLAERAGDGLDPAVTRRLLSLAAGNPLALTELPRTLSEAERDGREPLPERLRIGEAIARAFGRRLDGLDPEARRGVVVAAVGAEDPRPAALAAARALGVPPAALRRAEAAGVVALGPERIVFAHPLLRAAALELAPQAGLREAHRAMADAIGPERDLERRAWHLARAAVGPDEAAADALDRAAGVAAARTAYAAAGDALVRAAGLTADADGRARRLLRAAGLARMSGRFPLAARLLEEAAATAVAPLLAAEIDHLRGLVLIYTGRPADAVSLLFATADRIAADDPDRAALLLADSAIAVGIAGHPAMSIVACRRALALAGISGTVMRMIDLRLLGSLCYIGEVRRARALAVELQPAIAELDPFSVDPTTLLFAAVGEMYAGEIGFAAEQLERVVRMARDAGAFGLLGFTLSTAADIAFRRANWAEAVANAEEAAAIAEESGQIPVAAYALVILARLEAATGREAHCRAHLARAGVIEAAVGSGALEVLHGHVLGLLELGLGNHAAAIEALEPARALWEGAALRCAEVIPWRHDLIEAYLRVGRLPDARRELRTLAEEANGTGGAGVRALAARCRGLIDPDFERHFEEALALHEELAIPFDVARTRLCYGERLHRERRRARAREQLELALEGFDALGAEPWAERARVELATMGSRVAAPDRPSLAVLTPRELQVALTVARGATNRDAAAALFLSEKTVERHLSAIYAKLGLRSRSELAARLRRAASPGFRGR
jgi:DNA-binding CsgD family transcriptional regulator